MSYRNQEASSNILRNAGFCDLTSHLCIESTITYAIKNGWLDKNWVSGYGYLLGGSAIKMPKPYLQNDEIWDLTQKFKLYCYFDKKQFYHLF